jgi:mono/diheme cytochrome c family protein
LEFDLAQTQHKLLYAAVVAVLLALALQLVRPAIPDAPVKADFQAPPEVKQILKNSCYNCHSNETHLPWFDQVVPAYWLVQHDVIEARKHLNFSELGAQPVAKQRGILYEAINQIQMGAMPLPSYRRVHPEATITPAQLEVLRAYVSSQAAHADESAIASAETAADKQFAQWAPHGNSTSTASPTLNGIAFLPDYKNWKAISSTDRFDNQTLRVILGNEVAVKAIAENKINPWPDGTIFAKVAWFQQPDDSGIVRTGAFQQVEFMIRDSKKYASTKGWGWARWRGTDLKPYGANAHFTEECVSCHTPVRDNDYVFTMPIRSQLAAAK